MTEQPVFWRGRTPGKKSENNEPQTPDAVQFEPAVRDACKACGYEVSDYFAALGDFGGWLAHMQRDGQQYRAFWNGKSKQLTFEQSRLDGWHELATAAHEDTGLPGFVASLKALLGTPPAG